MALTNCSECKKEVSDTAETCPHCGFKLKDNKNSNLKKTDKKTTTGFAAGCGALLILIIIIAVISNSSENKNKTNSNNSSTVQLSTDVTFTGSQFVIVNKDSFNWTKVKIEINSHGLKSGYVLNVDEIKANKTYTVGAMQFANSNGQRFNPFEYKVQNICILCDTPNGDGIYEGSWKE